MEQFQSYFVLIAIVLFVVWKVFRLQKAKADLPQFLKEGAVVIDVRTPAEYASGSSPGSLNIPLNRLEKAVQRLDKDKPVVLCCASGSRSSMAVHILKRKGFQKILNIGPWQNVTNS